MNNDHKVHYISICRPLGYLRRGTIHMIIFNYSTTTRLQPYTFKMRTHWVVHIKMLPLPHEQTYDSIKTEPPSPDKWTRKFIWSKSDYTSRHGIYEYKGWGVTDVIHNPGPAQYCITNWCRLYCQNLSYPHIRNIGKMRNSVGLFLYWTMVSLTDQLHWKTNKNSIKLGPPIANRLTVDVTLMGTCGFPTPVLHQMHPIKDI